MPWKLRPPPVPAVFASNALTVAYTRYCAPVSLPIFAPVFLLMRPAAARSCSSSTLPSFSRSTTLNLPVDDSSLVSMPARSRPASEYHQLADVSFVNSATPTDGLSEPNAIVAKTRVAANKKNFPVRISHLRLDFGVITIRHRRARGGDFAHALSDLSRRSTRSPRPRRGCAR